MMFPFLWRLTHTSMISHQFFNRYLVSDVIDKRTWAIIWGCVFTPIAFVPTFRHYRLLSILGIGTTTYVSSLCCFMYTYDLLPHISVSDIIIFALLCSLYNIFALPLSSFLNFRSHGL